jgi:hypothetical protein
MRTLPKFVANGLTGVLSLFLLFSSTVACWAQLVHPMAAEACCAHGACKRVPGQPARSSCQTNPANLGQFVPPIISSTQVTFAAGSFVDVDLDVPAVHIAPVPRPIDYSPPKLFLTYSSFLI